MRAWSVSTLVEGYDTTTPSRIPRDAGLVLYYTDGAYRWSPTLFPNALAQSVTAVGAGLPADWGDVELGCLTVDEAIDLHDAGRIKGFYSDLYNYGILYRARPAGPFWVANPTGSPHMYAAPNVVGTQWAQNVGGLDLSEFEDSYLQPTPQPGPTPAPPVPLFYLPEADPMLIVPAYNQVHKFYVWEDPAEPANGGKLVHREWNPAVPATAAAPAKPGSWGPPEVRYTHLQVGQSLGGAYGLEAPGQLDVYGVLDGTVALPAPNQSRKASIVHIWYVVGVGWNFELDPGGPVPL